MTCCCPKPDKPPSINSIDHSTQLLTSNIESEITPQRDNQAIDETQRRRVLEATATRNHIDKDLYKILVTHPQHISRFLHAFCSILSHGFCSLETLSLAIGTERFRICVRYLRWLTDEQSWQKHRPVLQCSSLGSWHLWVCKVEMCL